MIVGIALAAPGKETAVDGLNERQVGSCTLPNGARRSRTAAHSCATLLMVETVQSEGPTSPF